MGVTTPKVLECARCGVDFEGTTNQWNAHLRDRNVYCDDCRG